MGRARLLLLLLLPLATLAVACGGGDGGEIFPRVVTLGEGDIYPAVANRTLAVGENRFSLKLFDKDDEPLLGATVRLRFFDLTGAEPQVRSETDARFIPIDLSFVDELGTGETEVVGQDGVYVAYATFDRAGDWGVQVFVSAGGREYDPLPFRFTVLEKSAEPAIGDPAPLSRQTTLADVADVSEIDTSEPPRPHMHDITIADAVALGRPLVVAFATPAFCETRTCGPVMDTVMDPLYERYSDRATFIHVEPYALDDLRRGVARTPVPAMGEWGLQTEPWVFVIDAQGLVAAKFEGIAGLEEVAEALEAALASP